MSDSNIIHISGFNSVTSEDTKGKISILEKDGNKWKVGYDGKIYNAVIRNINLEKKELTINISGYNFNLKIEEPLDTLINQLGFKSSHHSSVKEIKAPMPGLVVALHIQEGDTVNEGDKLLSLEAMKMENILKSPSEGVVSKILVQKGETVDKNQILIIFE